MGLRGAGRQRHVWGVLLRHPLLRHAVLVLLVRNTILRRVSDWCSQLTHVVVSLGVHHLVTTGRLVVGHAIRHLLPHHRTGHTHRTITRTDRLLLVLGNTEALLGVELRLPSHHRRARLALHALRRAKMGLPRHLLVRHAVGRERALAKRLTTIVSGG